MMEEEVEGFAGQRLASPYNETTFVGFPSPAEGLTNASLSLDQLLVRHAHATFFMRAGSHSMSGAGIQQGDYLVVDRSINALSGHIVVAVVDGEMCLGRLKRQGQELVLMSEPKDKTAERLDGGGEREIWGVVCGLARKF